MTGDQGSNETEQEKSVHPLQFSWTFWYDMPRGIKPSQENWSNNVKAFAEIDSVEKFWAVINNIVEPSRLPPGSNLHVFKQGIRPEWEDAMNEAGGKWVVTLPKKELARIDEFWLNSLIAILGEHFEAKASDDICGFVVSVRRDKGRLALWNKSALREDLRRSIGKRWREVLCERGLPRDLELEYMVHKDAMAYDRSYVGKALDRL
ncbi:hypothetical protein CCYA_CCYA08G2456 [Cyanidiococcus yangmingshanensis]|uniref:Translation initiation factor eIF4E n=1 Tax=Cyanidiococcus yangmingshanensis TaxID=2690220 RepID=A0A7J7IIJ1_9RHOD|nr:translation initiation factor eIF4E [Cyanidiococcus yangmingshanensis]KAK4531599.1 hypothetical protein CCYA_CCYA08G2456 [Cyanidiococcus yangmingshanensis]